MSGGHGELPHEAFLVALASLEGVGPGRMRWLLSLGSPRQAWDAVRRAPGARRPRLPDNPHLAITPTVLDAWRREAAGIDPEALWQRCVRLGVGVVSLGSPGYPPSLTGDVDPPVLLCHLGDPDVLQQPRVAIIGTRRATGYGLRTAELLGRELAEAGVSVVSGLALGIDAAAHRGATSVDGAPPAAVVGGGLDEPCPARNRPLSVEIARRGVVLSEVPPGVPAAPWRFPVRNRILAALAQVVVVVESAPSGGSMHTVREAIVRDRPVLAVPGPIDSRASAGSNQLLSEGAHPCLSTDDVLVALGWSRPSSTTSGRSTQEHETRREPEGDAAAVLAALGWRPTSAEQLALRTGLDFRGLSRALVELEDAGWVVRNGGWIERIATASGIPGRGGAGA